MAVGDLAFYYTLYLWFLQSIRCMSFPCTHIFPQKENTAVVSTLPDIKEIWSQVILILKVRSSLGSQCRDCAVPYVKHFHMEYGIWNMPYPVWKCFKYGTAQSLYQLTAYTCYINFWLNLCAILIMKKVYILGPIHSLRGYCTAYPKISMFCFQNYQHLFRK